MDPDSNPASDALAWSAALVKPRVRRWDQVQIGADPLDHGAVPVVESNADDDAWLNLEDGVQIRFAPGGVYRTGDYWLIPARVASGKVEWPQEDDKPALRPPAGVLHHYAPLGFVGWDDDKLRIDTCRCEFGPLSGCP